MTTEPNDPTPGEGSAMDGRGAEIGITEGEGSSFEPEEDPEGHDGDDPGDKERTGEEQAAENRDGDPAS